MSSEERIRNYCQEKKITLPIYTVVEQIEQKSHHFTATIVFEGKTFTTKDKFLSRDVAIESVSKIVCEEIFPLRIVLIDPESFRSFTTREYMRIDETTCEMPLAKTLDSQKFKDAMFITFFSKPDYHCVIDKFTKRGEVEICISKLSTMVNSLIEIRIGKLLIEYPFNKASFHIISRNSVFDSTVEYLKSIGYVSERIDEL